jgi:hypothetical protein
MIDLIKRGFSSLSILARFTISYLDMSEYVEGTFRCSICAKEFLSRDETKKHIKDTHDKEVTRVVA